MRVCLILYSSIRDLGLCQRRLVDGGELANKPGALAELAGRLAKKGINIDCAYATMPKGAKKAAVVLGTSKAGETGGA